MILTKAIMEERYHNRFIPRRQRDCYNSDMRQDENPRSTGNVTHESQEHDEDKTQHRPGNPLKNLDCNFRRAKAEQIMKFLKDQEQLNRRFSDFNLNSDDDDSSDYSSGSESIFEGAKAASPGDELEICDIEDELPSDCGSSVTSVCSNNTTTADINHCDSHNQFHTARMERRKLTRPQTTIGCSRPLSDTMEKIDVGLNKQCFSANPRTRSRNSEFHGRYNYNSNFEQNTLNVPISEPYLVPSHQLRRKGGKNFDLTVCNTRQLVGTSSSKTPRYSNSIEPESLHKNRASRHKVGDKPVAVVRLPPLGVSKSKGSGHHDLRDKDINSLTSKYKHNSSLAETFTPC